VHDRRRDRRPLVVTSYREYQKHRPNCGQCRHGHDCDEAIRLYTAMNADMAARRTPYVVRREKWGSVRHFPCWDLTSATSTASFQDGEIIDQTQLYVLG
jgi:hypothetical protein